MYRGFGTEIGPCPDFDLEQFSAVVPHKSENVSAAFLASLQVVQDG